MYNRDIYQKDPSTQKLINEGVANVNDEKTTRAFDVLRYELETFVCDGQYEKGLSRILETYLGNIEQAQQPAVWVSGFYGSGKSHLVKVLRALWVNTEFQDGATARGLAKLPQNITDLLKELSSQGKRHGGLHAASGTLASGAEGSVRLALLGIIFKSVGLPEKHPLAKFVLWLRKEGIFDAVHAHLVSKGYNWEEELDNFYVAEGLHEALVHAKPGLFPSTEACVEALTHMYPDERDISNDEMIKVIRQALTQDKKFPLTLIVLDEMQQYIGEDSTKSISVQETVESCCKSLGGKLLFIATGQTALTGTSNLRKLEGRFTIRIELSDADVDNVVRKVILAKKPNAFDAIENSMQKNLGEISRHLTDTTIGHDQSDVASFAQDYPILPVRRRFWEYALRALDRSGTASQLRSQLSTVHRAIQTNLEKPLANVIPADYLYFDAADMLLQSHVLPRKVHEKTMTWYQGTEDERLMARACGLVFLIQKLSSGNNEIGIKATVDVLADLMVEDLTLGSAELRSRLPKLLNGSNKSHILMIVGDEYRIQTEEWTAWQNDFDSEVGVLSNSSQRIDAARQEHFTNKFKGIIKKLFIRHGNSKISREIYPVFDSELPSDCEKKVTIWVRDGWSGVDESSIRAEARKVGNQSPTVFVFIPKRFSDELRRYLIEGKAAKATLDKRGVPKTPEGTEARSAMETTLQAAEGKITELLGEIFSEARVFQGGGSEVGGRGLLETIQNASENSLQRLYPEFHIADNDRWEKVYSKAKSGAPDALKDIGHETEVVKHPVCNRILAFIAGGKKGSEIRENFDNPSFGWPRDAIDGALQVLLVAGLIQAEDERNKPIEPKMLDRKAIGKTKFKVESVTVSTKDRLEIRKLFQKVGCQPKPGEEVTAVDGFLEKMFTLASQAGGEAPKPEQPDTSSLEEVRLSSGNEQLRVLYNLRDELAQSMVEWTHLSERIEKKWPSWLKLRDILRHTRDIAADSAYVTQTEHIVERRMLLSEPDMLGPILDDLTQLLRDELNELKKQYGNRYQEGVELLEQDTNWIELEPETRDMLLGEQLLREDQTPVVDVGSVDGIVSSLNKMSLTGFKDRVAALPSRFEKLHQNAAEELEPKIKFINIPRKTLRSETDIDTWLKEVRNQLCDALQHGPVGIG